jgi:hypothetical protein
VKWWDFCIASIPVSENLNIIAFRESLFGGDTGKQNFRLLRRGIAQG